MSVNIYDELAALRAQSAAHDIALADLRVRLAVLEAPPPPVLQVAPVSYFRSSANWAAVLASKPALAMINPGSGPGPGPDSLYVGLVPKCRAAGVPVFGYVHTRYSLRSLAEVKADVLNHKTWYGVDGIFVDTTSTKLEDVPYYRDLCAFIHAQGLKVCLNPGTRGPEEHAQIADYVMVVETYWDTYKTQARADWEVKYPGKLWHVIHTCPAVDMPAAVAMAKARGAGLVYVTNDVMPNPYDTLPPYYAGLCAEAASQ